MLRRLHLILAMFALLVAPIAMLSGAAIAATPMDHRETAQAGQCGDADTGKGRESAAMTQCCVAMCAAVEPLGAALIEPSAFLAPPSSSLRSTEHRAFLAKLPPPPPRAA